MRTTPSRGYLTLLALVFGSIFFMVLGALSSFVLIENRAEDVSRLRSKAFAIAEAGLEYYRWHLLHYPNDMQNGTGQPGPYEIPVDDPEGGAVGVATLSIAANTACGQTNSISIISAGAPTEDPTVKRVLTARYAQPSVAAYSYIINDNVWAGSDRIISGPYHANGGIRMDGTANAPVTSSVSTWLCTSSYGCNGIGGNPPTNSTQNGVFGAGPNQTLWQYPIPQMNFAAISANFSNLKTIAEESGLYLARYSSGSSSNSHRGYHLIFNSNGTVTVKRVSAVNTSLTSKPVDGSSGSFIHDYTLIVTESAYNTYDIPEDCGLIFVEDNTWIEGIIPSKITVVIANVTTTGVVPVGVLHGNIQYAATDGSDGLTVIAQKNLLIAPDSPTDMTLNGVFIAQSGAFGRNLYSCSGSYDPRGTLTILGTTVSYKRTGTKWVNGCGGGNAGGYQVRIDAYDRNLAADPTPFTPVVSTDFEFVEWREQ
ncbi:MAG: hypothetical protein Q7R54_02665 [bacterium]|nr:hypothetical protein [bacterium]